jgi:glucose-1-phosphate thymidylyltransferase
MNILLFEDDGVERLYPVTTGRPAWAISCAGCRLVDWLSEWGGRVVALVRPHLRTVVMLDYPFLAPQLDTSQTWTLCVNARLVGCSANIDALRRLAAAGQTSVAQQETSIAAALVPTDELAGDGPSAMLSRLDRFCHENRRGGSHSNGEFELLKYPHEIVAMNARHLPENLARRIEHGTFTESSEGVYLAPGARLGQYTVVDARHGPIVVDADADVGPHCFLRGPLYVGPGSRVIEHSSLKDGVTLGHTTKIGGEVESSVIEPYTNKQHHGFLGHSYLGSWINLGAGSCNSDLKNTYGEIKMVYRNESVATGQQFVGCIMGDYAKTAINTAIFTGKTVGVCSMLYGFVTTNVPSFVNYARSFGQVTELPPAVMVATQQRMFARRGVEQRPADVQLLFDMYELTRHERQLAEEPLVL